MRVNFIIVEFVLLLLTESILFLYLLISFDLLLFRFDLLLFRCIFVVCLILIYGFAKAVFNLIIYFRGL